MLLLVLSLITALALLYNNLKLNQMARSRVSPEQKQKESDRLALARFAREVFPQATRYQNLSMEGGEAIKVYLDKQLVGSAAVIFKDIACPVCKDVKFMIAADEEGRIVSLRLIEKIDLYGKPIEGEGFLKQFIGKTREDDLIPGQGIDAISGATKSSLAIAEGVEQFLSFVGRER